MINLTNLKIPCNRNLLLPVHTDDCVDLDIHCPSWAQMGECDKNPDYMHVNCRKSCHICGGGCKYMFHECC